MNKPLTYRKNLSILLVIVFITPLFIKTTHFIFVHHKHHHIYNTDKPIVYKKHKQCPICAFEFVEFIDNYKAQKLDNTDSIIIYFTLYIRTLYVKKSDYSFHLRAPPINL